MKKIFIFMLILSIILGIILFFYFRNINYEPSKNNISAKRLSNTANTIDNSNLKSKPKQEIASYSTEIKDDSEGRLTNIQITCSIINDTIVKPGETFSFNDVVGQPSSARGYQEATIIIDGEHERGIGGGNCQVSSTLYNAVLEVPSLTIIERNEHGLPVTYVPKGQDAAVSYGSLDFQFRNDSDKDIKIEITSDDESITAKIFQ